MVKFREDIVWETQQPIFLDMMNFMAFNDIFIDNHFIETKMNAVNPDGTYRSPRWVVNHGSLFARKIEVTPGGSLQYDSEDMPFFTKTYSFPGNNYWDSNYKPIVIITPEGNRRLPQEAILTQVSAQQITYTIYIPKKVVIDPNRIFKLNIFALGVKPVPNNDLDSNVDPSP